LDISNKIASDITVYTKYAKYIPKENRRETWEEIVNRCKAMHIKRYPSIKKLINESFQYVTDKEILPSMRSLQFAGKPIERNNTRVYNCAYHPADKFSFFHQTMFLLLGGTGVGFSVQHRHIDLLPTIKQPNKPRKYLIGDSIEGWADSIKALIKAYFFGRYLPRFDFSDVREKGTPLKTAGGLAPGPAPLRECLAKMLGIFESKPTGSRLTSTEVADLTCFIAQAVLSGGIRRSAMICLFDNDDEEMLAYKSGKWGEIHPERGMVNVSAVMERQPRSVATFGPYEPDFQKLWSFIQASNSGEPGVYWTNDTDWGTNPCCEIALKPRQFCNLTTINATTIRDQKDLEERAYYAGVIGTLQAGYTDFHYLGEDWKDNCDEEALLGVSVTGLADSNRYRGFNWEAATTRVKEANAMVAKAIEIKRAARLTCIKPEGTSSLVLGTSSGIHARHSLYYVRRIRFGKDEPIAVYLQERHPELVVPDQTNPMQVIVELPIKSPDRSIYRTESALNLLERARYFHEHWVLPGHSTGQNTHNISCTVSIKPEEWDEVGKWMWDHRDDYNGIATMVYDLGDYVQPPHDDITKEKYEEMLKSLKKVDLSNIRETKDGTRLAMEVACSSGKCEI
jgi:ribonucleoside-diphosphate reductase alpha chain